VQSHSSLSSLYAIRLHGLPVCSKIRRYVQFFELYSFQIFFSFSIVLYFLLLVSINESVFFRLRQFLFSCSSTPESHWHIADLATRPSLQNATERSSHAVICGVLETTLGDSVQQLNVNIISRSHPSIAPSHNSATWLPDHRDCLG